MRNVLVASAGVVWLGVVGHAMRSPPATPPSTGGPSASQASSSIPSPALPQLRALVDTYCVSCHNERLKTAGLMLDKADAEHVGRSAAVWEKVVEKLRSGAMPPRGVRRPDKATYNEVATALESALDTEAASNPNPGRSGIHRLNRVEYANAVRDLTGVEVDGRALLPADEQGYGFDNIADALSVTPGLLDRYISAAAKISRLAIGDPTIPPGFEKYNVLKNLWQSDRLGEEFPFGSRGGLALRHYFPVDAEYVIQVRLTRTYTNLIRGLGGPNQIDVRLDGARVGKFVVGGKFKDQNASDDDTPAARALRARQRAEYVRTADDDLEIRVPVKAGARQVMVTLVKTGAAAPQGLGPAHIPIGDFAYADNPDTEMGIATVLIGGPYQGKTPEDGEARRRIFICRPTASEEAACAAKILSRLAGRAYRRPASDADLQTLMKFYQSGRAQGGFDAGIRSGLEMILVSPDFLFRIERDPASATAGRAYRISDVELASRLSFFLWSSIPDDELLDLATRRQLNDPVVLDQQIRRMLADPRGRRTLVENFLFQWLQVRNISAVTPDTSAKFPVFDDNLRLAFSKETELFLASQLAEDRSVVDLLDADYTFLNEQLARHYGIAGVYGSNFRRVTLTDDNRRGLLGQGSILTLTSASNRTSPTLRGKWVLENLLASPMPPPPPDVPALKEDGEGGKPATVREALEAHRKNPACASCHVQMDPLGLALENFDGIGRWRTIDNGKPIDASGMLADGTTFRGPGELRRLLLARQEQFVTSVSKKLLIYALGRNVDYNDAPAIRKIVHDAAPDRYRWSSLITGVIQSPSFQMRMPKS